MVKIQAERGIYAGRTHEHIRAKERARVAGILHEAYTHPNSLHVSYRILKGGKLLDPDIPLESKHLKSVPSTADDAFERLHSEWNREREKVDIPLFNWGLNAADATMQLLRNADYVRGDLVLAFHGWGISVNGLALSEREKIAAGFVGDFYKNYCGANVREGMANMARQLVSTFVELYGLENDHSRYLVEKSVLLVLDSMRDWLTRFYGREDLQEAFTACVKAEMAVGAGRLSSVEKLEKMKAAPLDEKEKGVLRTIHNIPSSRSERRVLPRRSASNIQPGNDDVGSLRNEAASQQAAARGGSLGLTASSDAQEEKVPVGVPVGKSLTGEEGEMENSDMHATIPVPAPGSVPAAFVDPEILEHFGVGEQPAERQALPTLEGIRRDIVKVSIKQGKYYPTRAQLFPLLAELASSSKESYDTQSHPVFQKVRSIVDIGDLTLLLNLEAFLNPKDGRIQDMSTLLDRVIGDSTFLGDIKEDFGLFTLDARREMRTLVATAAGRLGADNTVAMLAQDERDKLSEKEARTLVIELTTALRTTSQLQGQSDVWVGNMLALPTLGDQLWYFLAQVGPLERMYKQMRLEKLREMLRQAGKRSNEEEDADMRGNGQAQVGKEDGVDTVATRRKHIVTAAPLSAELDRFEKFVPPPLFQTVPTDTQNWWEPDPQEESGDDDDWTR